MKNNRMKALSLLLAATLCLMLLPIGTFRVSAKTTITSVSYAKGSNYTSNAALAAKLDKVFKGNCSLYWNSGCTSAVYAPLGSRYLTRANQFYVKSSTTGNVIYGWQCYIYANGVYNYLFREWVGHGLGFAHSVTVIGGGASRLSYSNFKNAGVKTGAYMRTTPNASGAYSSSGGHSMIVLSYSWDKITVLEGNADGNGQVRITTFTWSEFNSSQLYGKGRYLCHVVQPTYAYYNALY